MVKTINSLIRNKQQLCSFLQASISVPGFHMYYASAIPPSYTSDPPSLKSLSYFFVVVTVLRMTRLTEGTEISPDLASFNYSGQCLLK